MTIVNKKIELEYIISFFIVIISYHIMYGINTILPSNVNWLMSTYHDWGTHYLGAAFYRNEPWGFPLGNMNNYYYPVGTNVGFTDSAPLLAFLTKLFSGILPEKFQYLGICLFACQLLLAFYTIKIFKLYKVNRYITIIAVVLVSLNPVFIFRGIHPALCSHFLLLASLYYYLIDSNKSNAKSINLKQVFILFIAATLNPYITFMVAGFNVILPIKNYFYDKSISFKNLIFFPILSAFSVLFFWIVFGMIQFKTSTNLASVDSFNQYSFNLNSFYNSYGHFSEFLPDYGYVNDKQYEGFAYFGIGMMVIILIFMVCTLIRFLKDKNEFILIGKKYWPLFLVCFSLFLFSITNEVTLGTRTLIKLPLPGLIEKLGYIFRASGRFVWPLYYVIFVFSLLSFTKLKISTYLKLGILSLIMGIQIYDIQYLITFRELKSGDYHTALKDDKWIKVFKEFEEIITYPPFETSLAYNMDYQDLCFLALEAKKPITNGYVARSNIEDKDAYKTNLLGLIKSGSIGKNQLFITTEKYIEDFDFLIYKDLVTLKKLDNFIFVYSKEKAIGNYFDEDSESLNYINIIIDKYKNRGNLKPSKIKLVESNAIQFYFDEYDFNKDENALKIRGWAFIKDTDNNKGDSIFIALSNNRASYLVPLETVSRQDITGSFKKTYLDDSGINTLVFTDKLEKGNYTVGIMIKAKNGITTYTKTNEIITTDNVKISVSEQKTSVKGMSLKSKFDLRQFSPIQSKNGKGLVFFENSSTKSPQIQLEKGNYTLKFRGISYPSKPINGENAHFQVKINGKKLGEFYLEGEGSKVNPIIDFTIGSNQNASIELTYDNDILVKGEDRNAIISEIEIIKK